MQSLIRAQLRLAGYVVLAAGRSRSGSCRCCSGCCRSADCTCSAYPCRGCCSASRSTRGCSGSACWYVRRAERNEGAFEDLVERQRPAMSELTVGAGDHAGDRRRRSPSGAFGLRVSRTTSDFFVASRRGRPVPQRLGDQRRVPLRSVVPRRGRAGAAARRRHALVPGRLDRRLPPAAGLRRRAAAPLGRLHAAGLRGVPGRVADGSAGRQLAGRADRRALPGAAVPGSRADPARRSPGRRRGSAPWSWPSWCWSTSSPAACAASRSCRRSSTGSSCAPCSSRRSCCGWLAPRRGSPSRRPARADWVEPMPGRHTRCT